MSSFFSSHASKEGNAIIAVIFWVCPLSSKSFSPVWNTNEMLTGSLFHKLNNFNNTKKNHYAENAYILFEIT